MNSDNEFVKDKRGNLTFDTRFIVKTLLVCPELAEESKVKV